MHLRIKLLIVFGVASMMNVSECQLGHKSEKSDDIKREGNSDSNKHGSAEREVTKYINGSRVKITKRAVVMPDNVKTGYNGSFPFNLTRTKRQIPSGPPNTLMGGTIGGGPPPNGSPPSNGMSPSNGMPALSGMPASNGIPPSPAINTGVPAVFNQPAVATVTNGAPVVSNTGSPASVAAPGPVVFPPS